MHRNAAIVVDAVSLRLLKGSTLDYATELIVGLLTIRKLKLQAVDVVSAGKLNFSNEMIVNPFFTTFD